MGYNGRGSSSGYQGVRVQRAWVLGGYEGDWGGADGLGLTLPGHGIRAREPYSPAKERSWRSGESKSAAGRGEVKGLEIF